MEGSEVLGKAQGSLEVALEQARNQLEEDSTSLRRLVLTTVNDVWSVLHQTRSLVLDNEEEVCMVPLAENANEKLTAVRVLAALRESLTLLSLALTHTLPLLQRTRKFLSEMANLDGCKASSIPSAQKSLRGSFPFRSLSVPSRPHAHRTNPKTIIRARSPNANHVRSNRRGPSHSHD